MQQPFFLDLLPQLLQLLRQRFLLELAQHVLVHLLPALVEQPAQPALYRVQAPSLVHARKDLRDLFVQHAL